MPFVQLRHRVVHYAKWKRVVLAAKAFRKANGELSFQVFRSSDDANDLTVLCAWTSAARARKFLGSAELRKRMQEAGVVGKPEIRIFAKAEDLSVGRAVRGR